MKKLFFILSTFALLCTASQAQTTLAQRDSLANDQTFQKRVKVAIIKTAIDVIGEKCVLPAADCTSRYDLARTVLDGGYLTQFCFAMASLGTLVGTITDNDILFTASAVWNDLAGVK